MGIDINKFTLTKDHVKLLSKLSVESRNEEINYIPSISGKRPFGNSDHLFDIARILRWKLSEKEKEDRELSSSNLKKAETIFKELTTALEIVLTHKSFRPGSFKYNTRDYEWERAE